MSIVTVTERGCFWCKHYSPSTTDRPYCAQLNFKLTSQDLHSGGQRCSDFKLPGKSKEKAEDAEEVETLFQE